MSAAVFTPGAVRPPTADSPMSHAMRRARAAIVAATCFDLVSQAFNVPVAEIRQVKGKAHAPLRYAAYWLATEAGGVPVYALAKALGVDRKAVMHGLARLPLARAGGSLLDLRLADLDATVRRFFPRGPG